MSYTVSILGANTIVNTIIKNCCIKKEIDVGYSGDSIKELLTLIETRYAFHILFLLPSAVNVSIFKEIQIRENLKINIIVVGSILPEDNISFLLHSGISGFVSWIDLNCNQFSNIITDIHKQGFVVNKHINKFWWATCKKKLHQFPRNRPDFSKTELEVAYYLANGRTIAQIAGFRNRTESSIRFHINNLLLKSNTYSIREFIITCIANIWVRVDLKRCKE